MTVIDELYGASLDANRWSDALASTVRLLGGLGGSIEFYAKQPTLQIQSCQVFGLSEEGAQLYANHYHKVCPRFGPTLASIPGEVRYDYLHHNEAAMERSEFYEDFLREDGLRYYISGTLENSHEVLGVFSIQRTPSQGHANEAEIELARTLLPHLRRAIAVSRRLSSDAQTLASLMEVVTFGLLIVDLEGRIEIANDVARGLLMEHPGLNDGKQTLSLVDSRLDKRLRASLASLCKLTTLGALRDPPAPVLVPETKAHEALLVVVSPILAEPTVFGFDGVSRNRGQRALVILHPSRQGPDDWLDTLRDHFRLTPAEVLLTHSLLCGRSLGEHSDAHGVSLNTTRTHWAHVRSKTDCKTQAELVRKLNALVPPIRR